MRIVILGWCAAATLLAMTGCNNHSPTADKVGSVTGPTASGPGTPPPVAKPAPPAPPPVDPNCGMHPDDWCPAPAGDPCGAHKDRASCQADPKCVGMHYRGESVVACNYDTRGFAGNCPTVGCMSGR